MDFKTSTEYLLSLGNEVSAMKLGLDSIRTLLSELGSPQERYMKVQVAGTNGKGSVCAFLNSICIEAGIRVGMYTSPHLVSVTERVKINGADIGDDNFALIATRVRETSEALVDRRELDCVPTFFEQVTAIALLAFADARVELAILETGLGGRLDATTAANAEIAAITRIDHDHQQYLGETLAEIATEKTAIIHAGSRVVISGQAPEAMQVILESCRSLGVLPVLAVDPTGAEANAERGTRNAESSANGDSDAGETTEGDRADSVFRTPHSAFSDTGALPLGLHGRHQFENARVAVAVANMLRDRFTISDENIAAGLRNARHPGRLEYIGRFLLDGAHNVGGARALRNYLDEFVEQPITMIFGAMNDKAVADIASVLFSKADRLIITRADNTRAMDPSEIARLVPNDFDPARILITEHVAEAVSKALSVSAVDDIIVATGSLYLVGDVRGILTKESPE